MLLLAVACSCGCGLGHCVTVSCCLSQSLSWPFAIVFPVRLTRQNEVMDFACPGCSCCLPIYAVVCVEVLRFSLVLSLVLRDVAVLPACRFVGLPKTRDTHSDGQFTEILSCKLQFTKLIAIMLLAHRGLSGCGVICSLQHPDHGLRLQCSGSSKCCSK